MPCSNCNSQQYADWVARLAEIEVELAELETQKQQLNSEKSDLMAKKAMCDAQGGPA